MALSVPRALTDRDLAALRRAAALARLVGTARVEICDAGATRVRVTPDAPARRAGEVVHVTPCRFHRAVAEAWAEHEAGRAVGLAGARGPLDVRWWVPPPGQVLGFGALRTTCAGRFVWAFASLLSADELLRVLGDATPDTVALGPDGHQELTARLAPDEALGATVVHVDADVTDATMVRAVDEVMRTLLATTATAELLITV